jgi:hypothetical protein
MAKGNTAGVCRRVARAYELDTLQFNPGHIGCPPEATGLDELTYEGYDPLSPIFIGSRKVDFVAEHDKPATQLNRGK